MNRIVYAAFCAVIATTSASALAADAPLTIVRDVGGVSALPYYEGLHLRSQPSEHPPGPLARQLPAPEKPEARFTESALLPVVSRLLTPGTVVARPLRAPGFTPMFLIGDDSQSRKWLRTQATKLRALHAVGLVVNVASAEGLASLRAVAPDLTLAPASGDDLAQRLKLHHYPVLITATAIEQ